RLHQHEALIGRLPAKRRRQTQSPLFVQLIEVTAQEFQPPVRRGSSSRHRGPRLTGMAGRLPLCPTPPHSAPQYHSTPRLPVKPPHTTTTSTATCGETPPPSAALSAASQPADARAATPAAGTKKGPGEAPGPFSRRAIRLAAGSAGALVNGRA